MALVNTKIKYPDDKPDCTQAFRVARRKEKKEKKHTQETVLFRVSQAKKAPAANVEMPALESWRVGRHGGEP